MLKKVVFVISFVVLLILGYLLYDQYQRTPSSEYQTVDVALPVHYSGEQFAGSESCIPCHQEIHETHSTTAHYNTSAPGDTVNILGSFNDGENTVNLAGSLVSMTLEDGSGYQTSKTYHGKIFEKSKMDITIGSGVKGQSYLTFEGDSLYQLQASYFTLTDNWINSPGYPNYSFKRPVMDNCIKCHVTFAKNEKFTGDSNVYDKNSFMYGVDCERCHGPSQEHVDFRLGNAEALEFDPMVKIATLNRQQQMDACAQCHAGLRNNQISQNPFSFLVGDNLEEHSQNYNTSKPNSKLDVHGNQYGLLISSKCYKESTDMTCVTCHDPHKNQRGNSQLFNATCISCHTAPELLHPQKSTFNTTDYTDCISCHMPESPSSVMKVRSTKNSLETSVNVRTHLIGVYVDSVLQTQTRP